jgi:hypothetical protein
MATVTFQGNQAVAQSPEGQKGSMAIAQLLSKMAPERADTSDLLLPRGVRCVKTCGPVTIWVHETEPTVFRFKWIAADSATRCGKGTKYREVSIGLPYLIVMAVFTPGEHNRLQLSGANECFFRTAPLKSLDDALLYPALLNCSKYRGHPREGVPLSWICTQYLDRTPFINEPDTNKRMRLGLQALLHCLEETGFNYSSETHEGSSWFTESTKVDPRVATIEKWEAATANDPLFALEVPWIKTELSVQQVINRIFKNHRASPAAVASASDVARLIFNNK